VTSNGVNSGLSSNGASIFLYSIGGVITGSTAASAGTVNTSNTIFTLGVSSSGVVTLTQAQQIDHPIASDPTPTGAPFDDHLVTLANGLVTLTATAATTDFDGDTAIASSSVDLGGNVRFADDGPNLSILTNISGPNTNAPLQGTYTSNIGADQVLNSSYDGVVLNNFSGTTGGGRAITNQTLNWASEDSSSVIYNFSFKYYAGPASITQDTATGTVVFNKLNGTYTFDLDSPIGSVITASTSSAISQVNYDTQGNNAPEIVAQQYSSDFWGVLTARTGPSGGTSGLGTTDINGGSPNLAYVSGDLLENDIVNYLNVSTSTVGIGSDTIQPDELLNYDFYKQNPVTVSGSGASINPAAPRAYADSVSLVIDQLNFGSEDIAVLIKLYNITLDTYSTKLLIANNSADYVLGADGFYHVTISTANYDSANYKIYGVQVITSTDDLTGNTGFSLTGNNSVTLTADGSNFADTSDSDIIKIIRIETVTTKVSTYDTDLQFNGALIDADGDQAPFNFSVHLEADGIIAPIVFDLHNDGFTFIAHNDPTNKVLFDWNNVGQPLHTAWIGAMEAFLVYDINGDQRVNSGAEVIFADPTKGAYTDLQGLKINYDTNNDDVLNYLDSGYQNFGLWQDLNMNGVSDAGEFTYLEDYGIASLDVIGHGGAYSAANGDVTVAAVTTFTYDDGTQGTAADVSLKAYGADGTEITQTNQITLIEDNSALKITDDLSNMGMIVGGAGIETVDFSDGNRTMSAEEIREHFGGGIEQLNMGEHNVLDLDYDAVMALSQGSELNLKLISEGEVNVLKIQADATDTVNFDNATDITSHVQNGQIADGDHVFQLNNSDGSQSAFVQVVGTPLVHVEAPTAPAQDNSGTTAA
jgi:hypothetical protein